MPHSPRWHDGRLWVLESGSGTHRRSSTSTRAPSRPWPSCPASRAAWFAGRLAFVGLSQVRETATFGGMPADGTAASALCGVWVGQPPDGQTAGFLRFEELVQEIFDVKVLPGVRYPEIAEEGSDASTNSFVLPDAVTT